MPSMRESTPSRPMPTSASDSTMKLTSRGASTRQRTTSGAAIAARPSVSPKFTRLLPTALPSASDCAPTQAARALTASSGIDVAKATRTRPVTNGESP